MKLDWQACSRSRLSRDARFDEVVNSEDFLARLCEIPGIGKWTAQYVAMRALGEPDAFPTGDVGLLNAMSLTNSRELEARVEAWRPWRAYAVIYLWTCSASAGASLAIAPLRRNPEPRRSQNLPVDRASELLSSSPGKQRTRITGTTTVRAALQRATAALFPPPASHRLSQSAA